MKEPADIYDARREIIDLTIQRDNWCHYAMSAWQEVYRLQSLLSDSLYGRGYSRTTEIKERNHHE